MPGTQSLAASLLHIPTSIPGDINAITGDGAEITLQQAAVQELSDSLKGKLLLPNSAAYDQARSLLNPFMTNIQRSSFNPLAPQMYRMLLILRETIRCCLR